MCPIVCSGFQDYSETLQNAFRKVKSNYQNNYLALQIIEANLPVKALPGLKEFNIKMINMHISRKEV